jgi:hypothetical protein
MQLSSTSSDDAFGFIHTWAPNVQWSAVATGTNQENIRVDETHTIDAHMMQTQFVTAEISSSDFEKLLMNIESRNALAASIADSGWQVDVGQDADGVNGTAWGFKKVDEKGLSFLLVHAFAENCGGIDAPACKTYTVTVEETASLSEGDDL